MNPPRVNLGVINTMLADAIKANNLKKIGRIVDNLRAQGCNYYDIQQIACKAASIEPNDWETILYEVDTMESEE